MAGAPLGAHAARRENAINRGRNLSIGRSISVEPMVVQKLVVSIIYYKPGGLRKVCSGQNNP